jgi:glycosyltransferase involved in cell wall biosynthesis
MPSPPLALPVRLLATLRCDLAIACARHVADGFARGWKGLARKTRVAHPGINPAPYSAPAADVDEGREDVAVVGSISRHKRLDLALEVAARLAPRRPNFKLHIVGKPQFHRDNWDYLGYLDTEAQRPPLRGHVTLDGFQSDMPAYLQSLSAVLHCWEDEPFGRIIIEAMAAGLAVVAPASGGPAEIIEHGRSGLLYPGGDPAAAASSLGEVLSDRAAAREMGRRARERVEQLFTEDAYRARHDQALALVSARDLSEAT